MLFVVIGSLLPIAASLRRPTWPLHQPLPDRLTNLRWSDFENVDRRWSKIDRSYRHIRSVQVLSDGCPARHLHGSRGRSHDSMVMAKLCLFSSELSLSSRWMQFFSFFSFSFSALFFLFSSLFSLFSSLFSLFTSFLCHKVWSLPLCGLPHWCWRLHHPLFLQMSGSYSAFGCKEGEVPGKSTMNILGKVLQTIGIFTSSSSMRSFLHPGTALELSITLNTKCR